MAPVTFTIEYDLLIALTKVLGMLIFCWMAVVAIECLFELRLDLMLDIGFWKSNLARTGWIVLAIALPVCLAPFVRPVDDGRWTRFLQGTTIMALATPFMVFFTMKLLSMPESPHGPDGAFRTSISLLAIFYFLNAAIYLPGIFGWGQKT